MSGNRRRPKLQKLPSAWDLKRARRIAERFVGELADTCHQIAIAGSIRREKATVSDIEIVCEPILSRPPGAASQGKMFDEPADDVPLRAWAFGQRLKTIAAAEDIPFDFKLKADGRPEKAGQRYILFQHETGLKIDLFVVRPPASWGALLAIRTGPADFSRLLVTSIDSGGAMPAGMICDRGALWSVAPSPVVGPYDTGTEAYHGKPVAEPERIKTDTEDEFFAALDMRTLPPPKRDPDKLRDQLAEQRRQRLANAAQRERNRNHD